jgi:hypothetical protein
MSKKPLRGVVGDPKVSPDSFWSLLQDIVLEDLYNHERVRYTKDSLIKVLEVNAHDIRLKLVSEYYNHFHSFKPSIKKSWSKYFRLVLDNIGLKDTSILPTIGNFYRPMNVENYTLHFRCEDLIQKSIWLRNMTVVEVKVSSKGRITLELKNGDNIGSLISVTYATFIERFKALK